jgi:hypothetical protein
MTGSVGSRAGLAAGGPAPAARPGPGEDRSGWGWPGVEIIEGTVPADLPDGTVAGPLALAAPGRYLLTLPGVGGFLVERGRRVTVSRAPGATDADVACFLTGPIRQACWLQRGRFALRGCGVVIGGRAVVITGDGASGTSTVTAALALRGHPVLADGAVPVRAPTGPARVASGSRRPGGRPVADAADDSVQLWPRAMDRLGLDPGSGAAIRPGLRKRRVRFAPASPSPLAAVVALHRHPDVGAPAIRAAAGMAGVAVLCGHTALRPAVGALAGAATHFRWATSVAAAVAVVDLCTDRHRCDLDAVADAIERIAAGHS